MSLANQSLSADAILDETVNELPVLSTRKQVADFFGYSEAHISRLVRTGQLHAFQHRANKPGNPLRIPRAAVRAYLEKIAR